MELVIEGKARELKFNIGFLRELDKEYGFESRGYRLGLGLENAVPSLLGESLPTLATVVKCAVKGVSQNQVDRAIEDYLEEHGDEGLTELFDGVVEGLETSPCTRKKVKAMIGNVEETTKTLKAQVTKK